MRFLTLHYLSEQTGWIVLVFSKNRWLIDLFQNFCRPKIFRLKVISGNKLKMPKFFRLIRYFLISIVITYIRLMCVSMKSMRNQFLFMPDYKKIRWSFDDKLAKSSKDRLFPSFGDFVHVFWRPNTCTDRANWSVVCKCTRAKLTMRKNFSPPKTSRKYLRNTFFAESNCYFIADVKARII